MLRRILPALALGFGLSLSGAIGAAAAAAEAVAPGTILFRDDFDGTTFDTSRWMVGTWDMHRTRFGNVPTVANGLATLRLDTYNPAAPGSLFRGTEILSRQVFERGATGLEYEARLRLRPQANGLVSAFYTFNYEPGTGNATSDEIDFEFLSNWTNATPPGAGDRVLMTTYDDWNARTSKHFDQVHHSDARPLVPGLDLEEFNVFAIRWLPDRTEWLINGQTVHATANALADEPMPIKFNFWAPNGGWADAYSADLMPTADPAANRSFFYDVDYALVRTVAVPTPGPSGTLHHIPEPSSLALLALAAGWGLSRRRRW